MQDEEDPDSPGVDEDAVVELPLADVLDLHGFLPRDMKAVVADWLDAAWEAGRTEIRVVHGRGVGVQREMVRTLLARDPRVASFGDAPAEAGGWGATLVTLRPRP